MFPQRFVVILGMFRCQLTVMCDFPILRLWSLRNGCFRFLFPDWLSMWPQLSNLIIFFGSLCVYLVGESGLTLCNPWTVAHQAPLSMGVFQARILEWVAMPSSRGSSQPRTEARSPILHTDSLPSEAPGKPFLGSKRWVLCRTAMRFK